MPTDAVVDSLTGNFDVGFYRFSKVWGLQLFNYLFSPIVSYIMR